MKDFEKLKEETIDKLTLMDDIFMTAVFQDNTELTEKVLKIILDKDLKVTSVKTQYAIKNLRGRSLRLDIRAEDSEGSLYNIEIQRHDKGAGAKRARYHGGISDTNILEPGDDFENLPETYIIFITEHDVLKLNRSIYFIERVILGTEKLFDDKLHIVYVNNSIQDETPIGKLMHDFACADPRQMYYDFIASGTGNFKSDEGGISDMGSAMDYFEEQVKVRRDLETAENLIEMGKLALEDIAKACRLPLEKVEELAEKIRAEKK